MADTRTTNLNLYKIGSSSDNVGVHMIDHYNYNMGQLDAWIAAHDIASISYSSGILTITSKDGTTHQGTIGDAAALIAALDYSDSAVSGSYVTAVNETDGKIAVTREAADGTPTLNSTKMVTSGGVYSALSGKADSATTLAGYGISDAYTSAQTNSAISTAINALDVSDSAVAGSYVTAVSEANGSISVTREAADGTPTNASTKMVTSGGVYTALSSKAEKSTISDAYNASTAYAVGDHFIYNDVIYTVDVACTGITPPNANYYTANNLTDLIEANASQISTLTSWETSSITITTPTVSGGRAVAVYDWTIGNMGIISCSIYYYTSDYLPTSGTVIATGIPCSINATIFIYNNNARFALAPDGKLKVISGAAISKYYEFQIVFPI